MIFQTLFSEKALAKRAQREAVDARLQVTAPHEWMLVSGLGLALLALLIYGLLGEAEVSLSTDAVLVQPGERVDVLADMTGVVDEVFAQVGDALAEGEAIARLRPPRLARIASEPDAANENTIAANSQDGAPAIDATAVGVPAVDRAAIDETAIVSMRDIVAPRDGVLVSLTMVAGQRVESGNLVARLRAMSSGPPQALAFVSGEDALRLVPNMRAQVRVAAPGEDRFLILPARLEQVSLRAAIAPAWLTELGLDPAAQAHLLRATLTEADGQAIQEGTRGRLRIVLGERSFASLLFGGDRD